MRTSLYHCSQHHMPTAIHSVLASSIMLSFVTRSSHFTLNNCGILILVAQILSSCPFVNGQILFPYVNFVFNSVIYSKTWSLVGIMLKSTHFNSLHAFFILFATSFSHLPSWSILVPKYLNVDTCTRSDVPSLSYSFTLISVDLQLGVDVLSLTYWLSVL